MGFNGARGLGKHDEESERQGLACTNCRSHLTKIINSRPIGLVGRRRRYKCLECGSRFTTAESPVELKAIAGVSALAQQKKQWLETVSLKMILAEISRRVNED